MFPGPESALLGLACLWCPKWTALFPPVITLPLVLSLGFFGKGLEDR